MINKIFRVENTTQRILEYKCDIINNDINQYIQEKLSFMKYDESSLNKYFNKNVELQLKRICEQNNIEMKYYFQYLNLEKNYFDTKKRNLKKQVDNYNEFKNNVLTAKNEKEKTLYTLMEISRYVKSSAQETADDIFWKVEHTFKKIESYEHILINNIKNHMQNCNNFLKKPDMEVPSYLKADIKYDINEIFNYLLTFKDFTFYREHGIISRIIHFLFDRVVEKAEADLVATGLWAVVNLKTNKYCRIIVDNRNYEVNLFDKVNNAIEKDFLSGLRPDQRESILKIIRDKGTDHIIDLSGEQIDSVAKEIVTLIKFDETETLS